MPELWHCCVYLSLVRIKMRFPDVLVLGRVVEEGGDIINEEVILLSGCPAWGCHSA